MGVFPKFAHAKHVTYFLLLVLGMNKKQTTHNQTHIFPLNVTSANQVFLRVLPRSFVQNVRDVFRHPGQISWNHTFATDIAVIEFDMFGKHGHE